MSIPSGKSCLTKIELPSTAGEKLEWLDLSDNNFHQDLSFLQGAINLEGLNLSNNKFYGNLEPLKDMKKLRWLDISNTDIDSGLECLSETVRSFSCSANKRKDAKVKAIEEVYQY